MVYVFKLEGYGGGSDRAAVCLVWCLMSGDCVLDWDNLEQSTVLNRWLVLWVVQGREWLLDAFLVDGKTELVKWSLEKL
jgi:hypothetical protein